MGALRSLRRRRRRKKRPKVPAGATCFKQIDKHASCGERAPAVMECELCLQADKKFVIRSCATHCLEAREKMKSHILRKHPGTIPAWMVSTLAGRDMR